MVNERKDDNQPFGNQAEGLFYFLDFFIKKKDFISLYGNLIKVICLRKSFMG